MVKIIHTGKLLVWIENVKLNGCCHRHDMQWCMHDIESVIYFFSPKYEHESNFKKFLSHSQSLNQLYRGNTFYFPYSKFTTKWTIEQKSFSWSSWCMFNNYTINRLIILSLFHACWVFSSFHNALNSDMDYRIFNLSLTCACEFCDHS